MSGTDAEARSVTARWLLVGPLLVIAVLAAAALCLWGQHIAARLHPEVFRLLAQLVLLVGLGGVGSLVLEELNRARERREAVRTHLRHTFADVLRSYNKIKRIRRLLRAQAVRPNASDPNAVVYGEEYAVLLRSLNDAQLQLETHARLIDGAKEQYPNSKKLVGDLRAAEGYIGIVITEWERNLGAFAGTPAQKSLEELPALRCFLAKADLSFRPNVAEPISAVLVALTGAIRGMAPKD